MTVSFRSSATAAGSGTSITLNLPSGAASGDILIAYFIQGGGGSNTLTPPTGWTLIAKSSTSLLASFYYKVAGASEPSTYTWSSSGSTTVMSGVIESYKGTNPAIDVMSSAVSTTNGSGATLSITGVTTANAGILIACMGCAGAGGATGNLSVPTGFTNRVDAVPYTGAEVRSCDMTNNTVGSTGTISSAATATSGAAGGVLIQLYEAPVIVPSNSLFFGGKI